MSKHQGPDPKDAVQAELNESGVGMWQVWRHVKSGESVSLVALAINEVDLTPVVVYRAVMDGTTWVRPLVSFKERFTPGTMGGPHA